MNRRNAIKLTAALVLLLILAALISPALAGNEIIPEAPKVAAYRPTVIPRAPEVVATEPSEIESFAEALEAAEAGIDPELAEICGRLIWGEAGGIQDYAQRAAVVWCACNRADAWDMDIGDVLAVDQFHGLAIKGEVPAEHVELARDVLARWTLEAEGWIDVGRTLPEHYLYFEGDGVRNHYSTEYGGGEYWRA